MQKSRVPADAFVEAKPFAMHNLVSFAEAEKILLVFDNVPKFTDLVDYI